MLAIFASPFYIAILIWFVSRFYKFVDSLEIQNKTKANIIKRLSLIVFLLTACIAVGFLLPSGNLKRIFSKIGSYWLGISLYLILSVVIAETILFFLKKKNKEKYKDKESRFVAMMFVLVFTIGMSVYGIINAGIVRQTDFDVYIDKKCGVTKELTIGLISDTHFGYNIGVNHMKQTADIINNANCDLVILAGDIFDNEYDAIEEPDKIIELINSMESKYGTYYVLGNHDVEEKILCGFTFDHDEKKNASEGMLDFLSKTNMKLLYDKYELINNSFYIYGRPDYERPNFNNYNKSRVSADKITIGMNKDKPIICIDHEPRDYDLLKQAGVDLDLAGHTHDGQIWPTKYFCYLVWDNAYGLYKDENFNAITTSGVGLFGPNIRTATIAEVAIVHVKFK